MATSSLNFNRQQYCKRRGPSLGHSFTHIYEECRDSEVTWKKKNKKPTCVGGYFCASCSKCTFLLPFLFSKPPSVITGYRLHIMRPKRHNSISEIQWKCHQKSCSILVAKYSSHHILFHTDCFVFVCGNIKTVKLLWGCL